MNHIFLNLIKYLFGARKHILKMNCIYYLGTDKNYQYYMNSKNIYLK